MTRQVSASVRNDFLELLDGEPDDTSLTLIEQLEGCVEPLPQEYADIVGLAPGATFGDAAAVVRDQLRNRRD